MQSSTSHYNKILYNGLLIWQIKIIIKKTLGWLLWRFSRSRWINATFAGSLTASQGEGGSGSLRPGFKLWPENMTDHPYLRLHSLEYDEIFPKCKYQCPLSLNLLFWKQQVTWLVTWSKIKKCVNWRYAALFQLHRKINARFRWSLSVSSLLLLEWVSLYF